jgi:hypothetical protein
MGLKAVTITQPNPSGAFVEGLTDTVVVGAGTPDAGKVVITGANGLIDPSLYVGGETGPIPATEVSYDNPLYATVEAALNFLLYIGLEIAQFTADPSVVEIGSAVMNVSLTWVYNKDVVSEQVVINGEISVTVVPDERAISYDSNPPGFEVDQDFVLTASDGTQSQTATCQLVFLPKAYWGIAAATTLSNDQILALTSDFATALNRTITYDATGGGFPCYCYPGSFGKPSLVIVGGLQFSSYTVNTQVVTNASGFSQSYFVIFFNNLQNGSDIVAVWS